MSNPTTPIPEVANIIAGERFPGSSDDTIAVLNPATGEQLCNFTSSTPEDVDGAVRAAHAAFAAWSTLTPGQRSEQLFELSNKVAAQIDTFAEVEILDAGKPSTAAREVEFPAIVDALRHFSGASRIVGGQGSTEYAPGATTIVRREPFGVVAAITPWNYPLWQAIWKIVPALAAGNTVVVKPAENTPLTTTLFVQLAQEVLPSGVLNLVQGRGPVVGEAMVAHPDVAAVSFTGSTKAGRAIARKAGDAPKPVILELGGNAPVVIFSDADISKAVETLSEAALYNAGQECMAASRLIVHEEVVDEVVDQLAKSFAAVPVGDTASPETVLGPLISEVQRKRVLGLIEGRSGSAEVVTGGAALDRPGFYVEPTIVTGVAQSDAIVQAEVFGPVVTVQTFSEESKAVELANGVEYGLAGSVWTRDVGRALRVGHQMDFGNVLVNTHLVVGPEGPIGGFKGSGYGKEGGMSGADAFSRTKQVIVSLE